MKRYHKNTEQRALLSLGVLAANWPVLRWYAARIDDGGDEPWGLVALAAALALTPLAVWRAQISTTRMMVSVGLALAAAVSAGELPVLGRALLVVSALGITLGGANGALGRAALLALSLPLMATVQFYAGYPLRVATAELGRPLLALAGIATERVGVALVWTDGEVVVDAPCSGVRMLWMSGVLAAGLAAFWRLDAWRTVQLGSAALIGVVLANTLRAAVLFFPEAGFFQWPPGAHEWVGQSVFAGLAMVLVAIAKRWSRAAELTETSCAPHEGRSRAVCVILGLGCVLGASWPWLRTEARAEQVQADAFPGWPELFEGKPLVKRVRSEAFAATFPGETGVFSQDGRVVILRWLRAATRSVHPAADCFRARGYTVRAGGLRKDAQGLCWSEFTATRGDERWRVQERFQDERGASWTDVSAWYWAAQAAEGSGPWWAVTVARRE